MAAWHTRCLKQGSDGFPPATWHLAASRQKSDFKPCCFSVLMLGTLEPTKIKAGTSSLQFFSSILFGTFVGFQTASELPATLWLFAGAVTSR